MQPQVGMPDAGGTVHVGVPPPGQVHSVPHPPQLWMSLVKSTQLANAPGLGLGLAQQAGEGLGHTVPQAPQLAASLARSVQATGGVLADGQQAGSVPPQALKQPPQLFTSVLVLVQL
jgi:hypothetical protein